MNFYQYSMMALLIVVVPGACLAMELPEKQLTAEQIEQILANRPDDSQVTGRSRARREAAQRRTEQEAQPIIQEDISEVSLLSISDDESDRERDFFVTPRSRSRRQAAAQRDALLTRSRSTDFVDTRSHSQRSKAVRRQVTINKIDEMLAAAVDRLNIQEKPYITFEQAERDRKQKEAQKEKDRILLEDIRKLESVHKENPKILRQLRKLKQAIMPTPAPATDEEFAKAAQNLKNFR